MRVLLIAACSRSGCTILESVLGGYPGVFAAGELINLWQRGVIENRPCGCGEPFDRCPTWQSIMAEAFGELDVKGAERIIAAAASVGTVDVLTRMLPRGQARLDRRLDKYASSLAALVRGIDRSQQPAMIIDAGNVAHIEIYSSMPDVELSILHLVRDIRGTAHSTQRHKAYDPSTTDPIEMERLGPLRTGAVCAAQNLAFELERTRDCRYRRIRYEDFAGQPRAVVADVARWCGLDSRGSPFVSGDRALLGPNHIVSGNPSRFADGVVDITADDEWRTALSTRDRALLSTVFAPMLLRYGYPLRAGRGRGSHERITSR